MYTFFKLLLLWGAFVCTGCRSKSTLFQSSDTLDLRLMNSHERQIQTTDSIFIEHFRDSTKMDSIVYVKKTEIMHHYHTIQVHDTIAVVRDSVRVSNATTEVVRDPSILEIWQASIPTSLTLSIIFTLIFLALLLRKR